MIKVFVVFLILQQSVAFAQEKRVGVRLPDSIAFHADAFVGKDIFGAWYFIEDNTLLKKTRSKILSYKNPALGKISRTDLRNPLKIMLFYESFNTIVLIDNQLNEIQKIILSDNAIPIVAVAAGLASGNRVWIYNGQAQQIGLLDYLKVEYKPITTTFKGNVKYYDSDFNYFQWVDEKSDWYSCDVYGKVSLVGKIPDYDGLQLLSGDSLIYKKNNQLYYFTFNGNKTTLIDFDEKTFESFSYKDQILSIFTRHGITNYKIILP